MVHDVFRTHVHLVVSRWQWFTMSASCLVIKFYRMHTHMRHSVISNVSKNPNTFSCYYTPALVLYSFAMQFQHSSRFVTKTKLRKLSLNVCARQRAIIVVEKCAKLCLPTYLPVQNVAKPRSTYPFYNCVCVWCRDTCTHSERIIFLLWHAPNPLFIRNKHHSETGFTE